MANKSAGPIRLFVLGDSRIETATTVIEPSAEMVFAVALYLILRRKEPSSRRNLQRLLWPNIDPSTAAHRLRQTILKLRRAGLQIDGAGNSRMTIGNESIVVDYEELIRDSSPEFEWKRLAVLSGYQPEFSSHFGEWLDDQRQAIGAAITPHILAHIQELRTSGKWSSVEVAASAARAIAPYNEEITLALAESMAMRGAKLEAHRILDAYLVEIGPGSADLRFQAAALRRRITDDTGVASHGAASESPLVGRTSLLHELAGVLSTMRSGNGQAVMLVGEAGIGKSRLLAEFASFAGLQGVNTQQIHCRPSYAHRPLSAFVELVPSLRTLRGAIGCAPETLMYLDRLTKHEPADNVVVPEDNDPNWIYGRVLRALFDIFDAVSDEAPLLVQIEDVQWLDQTSANILRDMFAWSQTRPILFAMTAREAPDMWVAGFPDHLRTIHVTPLESDAAKELVANTAKKHGRCIDTPCLEWCVSAGEGNPYFLQELATHWAETGAVHEVPPSLSTLLGRRVDRLDSDALQILQTCAILENNSTLERLERVLEYQAHRLLNGINILGRAGMVVSDQDDREGNPRSRITSKHELLSNVALSRLSVPAKTFLHRRAGLVLEHEIEANLSTSLLWDCAKHWKQAGDPHRGLSLALSCGHQLMKVGLPKAAAEAYAKCLTLCTTDRQRAEVIEAETVAYYRLCDWHRVRETAAMARLLKSRIDPTVSNHDDLELMDMRAEWLSIVSYEIASRAIVCLRAEDASARHRIEAGVMAMMILTLYGNDALIRETYEVIESLSSRVTEVESLGLEAAMVFHTAVGDLQTGVVAARRLIINQRERGNVADVFRALSNAAVTFRVAGLFEDAQQSLLDALGIAESHAMEISMTRTLPMLANTALERGRLAEAKKWHEKLIALAVHPSNKLSQLEAKGISVRIALLEGDVSRAKKELLLTKEEAMSEKVLHRRAYNCALQIATDLISTGKTSADVLECMVEAFDQSKGGVHSSYSACVLYAALRRHGQADRAEKILTDYKLNFRREPWPIPDHLIAPLLK